MEEVILQGILKQIEEEHVQDKVELNKLKVAYAREHNLKSLPTDAELSNAAEPAQRERLKSLLSIKPVRTMAGVAPVALMTKPHKCPHGTCIYCPGGPNSPFGDVPQAYTGTEPATRRAIRNHYDPYYQVMNRLEHYVVMNQVPDKVEIIVMGGTFLSLHESYKDMFIKLVYKAMNDFSELFYKDGELDVAKFNDFFEMATPKDDPKRESIIHAKQEELRNQPCTLEEEQLRNETAKIRCVALVIETGAEACDVDDLLKYGCTRVELGVQSVYPEIVKGINRGHTAQDSIDKTKELKDAGFKVTYHMMPGLPEPNLTLIEYQKDLDGLKELFTNPDWRPDMIKLYPCMVMKGTELYKKYEQGLYTPMTTKDAAQMLVDFTPTIPEYCRIMRIQRDIPTYMTESGVDRTNLRQYVDQLREQQGVECRCIRCREIGRKPAEGDVTYSTMTYDASDGKEFFIQAQIKDSIVGFCRVRFPANPSRKEIGENDALLRELHVYGTATELGAEGNVQHKGVGKELMKQAEDICKEHHKSKLIVISGVGVKQYYIKQLGYHKEGPYVVKEL